MRHAVHRNDHPGRRKAGNPAVSGTCPKTGAPLNQNHWRTIGATQSLSRFCAIEFRLRKKASMAQKNNADRCNGAPLAQIAMLLLRARSAPNPLCSIGQRFRLTAPLGQRRTLITTPEATRS
jgi:hypothetical protein